MELQFAGYPIPCEDEQPSTRSKAIENASSDFLANFTGTVIRAKSSLAL